MHTKVFLLAGILLVSSGVMASSLPESIDDDRWMCCGLRVDQPGTAAADADVEVDKGEYYLFVRKLADGTYMPTSLTLMLVVLGMVLLIRNRRKK